MRERWLSNTQVADWFGTNRTVPFPARPVDPVSPPSALAFDARDFDGTNLLAWYSAQCVLGVDVANPADNDTVALWKDLSGNNRHQTLTGTARFRGAGMGSVPSVEYVSGASSKFYDWQHPQSWTVYAVVKSISASGLRGLVDADGYYRQAQYLRINGNSLESIAFNSGGSPYIHGQSFSPSTALALLVTKADSGGQMNTYINGTAGSPISVGSLASWGSWLGLNSASNTAMGNVHYGEVAMYAGAHNDTTRQAIQSEIADYYGITLA